MKSETPKLSTGTFFKIAFSLTLVEIKWTLLLIVISIVLPLIFYSPDKSVFNLDVIMNN